MRDAVMKNNTIFLGVHLSGANTANTSVTIAGVENNSETMEVSQLYSSIGSTGMVFSDDRVANIVHNFSTDCIVVLDCPLTQPICGQCMLEFCPGVKSCDDVAVAMTVRTNHILKRRGRRKKRPLNPQSQRLWDLVEGSKDIYRNIDPTYNPNKSQLYYRASILVKRINSDGNRRSIIETSVPHVLADLSEKFSFEKNACENYRSFERGRDAREYIVSQFVKKSWVSFESGAIEKSNYIKNLSNFNSLICAWIGKLYLDGFAHSPINPLFAKQGWVYTPNILRHH